MILFSVDINLNSSRKGLTLVELMVAMAIIVMFSALTVAFYPSVASDNELSRIANQIQGMLVGARQAARREIVPGGIRFVPNGDSTSFEKLILIQKPGDLIGFQPDVGPINFTNFPAGTNTRINVNYPVSFTGLSLIRVSNPDEYHPLKIFREVRLVQFERANVWDANSDEELVRDGDLLFNNNISTMPVARIIGRPNPTLYTNNLNSPSQFNTNVFTPLNYFMLDVHDYDPFSDMITLTERENYRIYRQPRIVNGEKPMEIPDNYDIPATVTSNFISTAPVLTPYCVNLKRGFTNDFDLVFDTNGAISNQSSTSDVYIWLRKRDSLPNEFYQDAVICIRKKNGAVGVFPIDASLKSSGGVNYYDPFSFARNPANEGL